MSYLFLHVGTHKTGTTSIQAYLFHNCQSLKEHDISVRLEGQSANNMDFAHAILRRSLRTGQRIRNGLERQSFAEKVKYIIYFRRELNALKTERIVISAEALCFARSVGERLFLRASFFLTGRKIFVLLVQRNPEEWKRSWMDQLRKDPPVRAHIEKHDYDQRIDKAWYFNFQDILNFWQKIGNVIVINYDEAIEKDGSVIPSFLEAIGAPRLKQEPVFLNRRANP